MSGEYSITHESFFTIEPVVLVADTSSLPECSSRPLVSSNGQTDQRRVVKKMYGPLSLPSSSGGGSRPKRGQANKRERVRTENVNAGFEKLRHLIPTDPIDRKLSKIEILRLATSYISHLYNLTRANSCLEAEEMDREDGTSDEDEELGQSEKVVYSIQGKYKHRVHVCTFCLMMTKSSTTQAKR